MTFPALIVAHDKDFAATRFAPHTYELRVADGCVGTNHRHCSYCGSVHPQDLLAILQQPGVELELADMKYGWPHKLYIHSVPNPRAGETVRTGARSEGGVTTAIMGEAPSTLMLKFYTAHLLDLIGYDSMMLVLETINAKLPNVRFFTTDDGRDIRFEVTKG